MREIHSEVVSGIERGEAVNAELSKQCAAAVGFAEYDPLAGGEQTPVFDLDPATGEIEGRLDDATG